MTSETKRLAAVVVAAAGILGAAAGAITNAQAIADAQPFATKGFVIAQVSGTQQLANVTRMDLLDFQITTLKNQVATLKMAIRQNPADLDLPDQLAETQGAIGKKQREFDLLKCLVQQRTPCVQ